MAQAVGTGLGTSKCAAFGCQNFTVRAATATADFYSVQQGLVTSCYVLLLVMLARSRISFACQHVHLPARLSTFNYCTVYVHCSLTGSSGSCMCNCHQATAGATAAAEHPSKAGLKCTLLRQVQEGPSSSWSLSATADWQLSSQGGGKWHSDVSDNWCSSYPKDPQCGKVSWT